MGLDPSQQPAEIEKGWVSTMYSEPPDLVLNEDTGFPAANPAQPSSLQDDPVPVEPEPDWRPAVKEWFDRLP